jgi:hypothetical protein
MAGEVEPMVGVVRIPAENSGELGGDPVGRLALHRWQAGSSIPHRGFQRPAPGRPVSAKSAGVAGRASSNVPRSRSTGVNRCGGGKLRNPR